MIRSNTLVDPGGGNLVLNSNTLKSLLTGEADVRKRKAAAQRTLEIVDMVMKEETGNRAKRFRKRNKKKTRRKSLIERSGLGAGLSKIRSQRYSQINVFEFAAIQGLPRDDIEYLERQYPYTKRTLASCSEKLVLGFEHLNGPEIEEINEDDAGLLLAVTGVDVEDPAMKVQRITSRPSSATQQDIPATVDMDATEEPNGLRILVSDLAEDVAENAMYVGTAHMAGDSTVSVSPKSRQNSQPASRVSSRQQSRQQPRQQQQQRLSKRMKFESYLHAFECFVRSRLLALSLAEIRGWAQRNSAQRVLNNRQKASVEEDEDEAADSLQEGDSLDGYGLPRKNTQTPHSTRSDNSPRPAASTYNGSDDFDNLDFPTPFMDSDSTSMLTKDSNHRTAAGESMFVGSTTMRPQSQPTRPQVRNDSNVFSFSNAGSSSDTRGVAENRNSNNNSNSNNHFRDLPPLRLRKRQLSHGSVGRALNKKIMNKAGFDASFSRPTPRVLQSKSNSIVTPSGELVLGASADDIEALRLELVIAQEGVKQLNKMVDHNIAWVQTNCDIATAAPNFSDRTKQKCRNMATERIVAVYADLVDATLVWALDRWRAATRYDNLCGIVKGYSKLKGIEIMSTTLYDAVCRQYLKGWSRWLNVVQQMIHQERDNAAVQIQRVVRGNAGRIRCNNIKLGIPAVVIENLFRATKARRIVAEKRIERQEKINDAAARVLQKMLNMVKEMRAAKSEAQRRREERATVRIQKIGRGKLSRAKVQQRIDEQKRKQQEEQEEEEDEKKQKKTPTDGGGKSKKKNKKAYRGSDLDSLAASADGAAAATPADAEGVNDPISIQIPNTEAAGKSTDGSIAAGRKTRRTRDSKSPSMRERGTRMADRKSATALAASQAPPAKVKSAGKTRGSVVPQPKKRASSPQHAPATVIGATTADASATPAAVGNAPDTADSVPTTPVKASAAKRKQRKAASRSVTPPKSADRVSANCKSPASSHHTTPTHSRASSANKRQQSPQPQHQHQRPSSRSTSASKRRGQSPSSAQQQRPGSGTAAGTAAVGSAVAVAGDSGDAVNDSAAASNSNMSAIIERGASAELDGASVGGASEENSIASDVGDSAGPPSRSMLAKQQSAKLIQNAARRKLAKSKTSTAAAGGASSAGRRSTVGGNPLERQKSVQMIQKIARGRLARKQLPLYNRRQSEAAQSRTSARQAAAEHSSNLARFSSQDSDSSSRNAHTPDSRHGSSRGGTPVSQGGGSDRLSRRHTVSSRAKASPSAATDIQGLARGKIARKSVKNKKSRPSQGSSGSESGDQSDFSIDGMDNAGGDSDGNFGDDERASPPLTPTAAGVDVQEIATAATDGVADADAAGQGDNPPTDASSGAQQTNTAAAAPAAEESTGQQEEEAAPLELPSPQRPSSVLGSICRIFTPGKRSRSHSPAGRQRSAPGGFLSSLGFGKSSRSSSPAPGALSESETQVADGAKPNTIHRVESPDRSPPKPHPQSASTNADEAPRDASFHERPKSPSMMEDGGRLDRVYSGGMLKHEASKKSSFAELFDDGDIKNNGEGNEDQVVNLIAGTEGTPAGEGDGTDPVAVDNSTEVNPVDEEQLEQQTQQQLQEQQQRQEEEEEQRQEQQRKEQERQHAREEKKRLEDEAKERAKQRRLQADEKRKEEAAKARAAREERERKATLEKDRMKRRSFNKDHASSKNDSYHAPAPPASASTAAGKEHEGSRDDSGGATELASKPNSAHEARRGSSKSPAVRTRGDRKASTSTAATTAAAARGGAGSATVARSKSPPLPSINTSKTRHESAVSPPRSPKSPKSPHPPNASRSPRHGRKYDSQDPSVNAAAARIQLLAHRKQAVKKSNEQREKIIEDQRKLGLLIHWAAVTLQRNARGKLGRKKFEKVAVAKKAEVVRQQQAGAKRIQTRARGMRDRHRVKTIREKREAERLENEWLKSYQQRSAAAEAKTSSHAKESQPESKQSLEASNEHKHAPSTVPTEKQRTLKGGNKATDSSSTDANNEDEEEESVTVINSLSALGIEKKPAAGSALKTAVSGEFVGELEQKIKQLEALERSIHEKEQSMIMAAKLSEEKALAVENALKTIEERAKRDEAERLAQKQLLEMAAGPISHRSEYASIPRPGGVPMGSARGSARRSMPNTARSMHSAPPTARSAKGAIPPHAPRMFYGGEEWVQLWDADEAAYYWYCERTEAAQWDAPGEEYADYEYLSDVPEGDNEKQNSRPGSSYAGSDSGYDTGYETGYDSEKAMTDYSYDHFDDYSRATSANSQAAHAGGSLADGLSGVAEWEEYFDEQAQANYWYNNLTGEASWTRPEALDSGSTRGDHNASFLGDDVSHHGPGASGSSVASMNGALAHANSSHSLPNVSDLDDANAWVSYIDEDTQQAYWYNIHTGDTSWA